MQDELESLPTVWLTFLHPWDPGSLEVTDKLVLPFMDRTSDNTIRAVTMTKLKETKHALRIGLTKGSKTLQTTKHSANNLGGYLWTLSRKPSKPQLNSKVKYCYNSQCSDT